MRARALIGARLIARIYEQHDESTKAQSDRVCTQPSAPAEPPSAAPHSRYFLFRLASGTGAGTGTAGFCGMCSLALHCWRPAPYFFIFIAPPQLPRKRVAASPRVCKGELRRSRNKGTGWRGLPLPSIRANATPHPAFAGFLLASSGGRLQDCEVELLHPDLADERLKRRLGRLSLLGHLVQHAQVGDDGRRRVPGRVGPQRVLQRGDGFGQPASVE